MINYRAKYERFWGFAVPAHFDIHHIDGNRRNNDVRNLTAIPRDLHREFHRCIHALNAVRNAKDRGLRDARRILEERVLWLEEQMQETALENRFYGLQKVG